MRRRGLSGSKRRVLAGAVAGALFLCTLGTPAAVPATAPTTAPATVPVNAPVTNLVATSSVHAAATAHKHDRSRQVRSAQRKRDERVTSGLEVTIEQLSPSSLVPGTPVNVSGTITNLDPHVWKDLKAYLVIDNTRAITSSEDLDSMLDSPADTYNGERICCREDHYDDVPAALGPGESTTYTLDVPFAELNLNASGVYTMSVQVLGERVDQGGRVAGYDGRARILVPYLSAADDPSAMAVVIPLHHGLQRLSDGTYEDADELVDSISTGGLLRNRLDLIAAAGSGQVTLLIDPALLDAVRAVANGDFGAAEAGGQDGADEPQAAAAEFLDDLKQAAARSFVLVEPYGRADLSALVQRPRYRLQRTVTVVGESALEAVGISADPVYRPVGELDPAALAAPARRRVLLVGSEQVAGWSPEDNPSARLVGNGRSLRVVVADTSLASGGLAPGPYDSALHVRQRLLAESAVLSLADEDAAQVFVPDDDWNPGPGSVGADLFDQLDTPWVSSASLTALAGSVQPVRVGAADPIAGQAPPLPAEVLTAARTLRRQATILEALTDAEDDLPHYRQIGVLALSSTLRETPELAAALADESVATIDQQLRQISIEGPQAVTLSSARGPFPLTFTNRLNRRVSVGARISAEDDDFVLADVKTLNVDPGDRVTVSITVQAPDVGVTTVKARLVTADGRPFGESVSFPLRSSAVGAIIWYAMGAIGVFVLLLIARRVRRRLRLGAPEPETPS